MTTRRHPTTLSASFEFNDGGMKKMMTFEVRHWITNHEAGVDGSRPRHGRSHVLRLQGIPDGLERGLRQDTQLPRVASRNPGPSGTDRGNHFGNFIDVVRSRKHADLNAPIEEGAISTTLVHLANISYRLGRTFALRRRQLLLYRRRRSQSDVQTELPQGRS